MERRNDRIAIVTGAGKRVGQVIAEGMIADGWTVVAHVHSTDDQVPDGAIKVVADLADPKCAEVIIAACPEPPSLLINNAARFAWDGPGEISADEFDLHMTINLRAPLLLSDAFAASQADGSRSLIVNILDSKLTAPNPDYLSYTLSKAGLAAATDLLARAYARRGVRVNGVAPALMLRSPGQSEENYRTMHTHNPLGIGVTPDDVLDAIRFLVTAKTITGQVITLDSGQRFLGLDRDVQFLKGDS